MVLPMWMRGWLLISLVPSGVVSAEFGATLTASDDDFNANVAVAQQADKHPVHQPLLTEQNASLN